MIIILHVTVALASVVAASYAYIRTSGAALRVSYVLTGATFASGFYLVWSAPAHMVQACTSGVLYLSIVSLAILAAKNKLAAVKSNI